MQLYREELAHISSRSGVSLNFKLLLHIVLKLLDAVVLLRFIV